MNTSPRLNAEVWSFPSGQSIYLFQQEFGKIFEKIPKENAIIITDENLFLLYEDLLKPYRKIIIKAGEKHKSLKTILYLSLELINMNADRDTHLIGFGGGMISDITGFLSASFMRGIKCTFVPTTLLAMVDASIGGKNGVNLDNIKNIIGTVKQPNYLFINTEWLGTLTHDEILNGMAEVVKYGFISDPSILLIIQNNIQGLTQNSDVLYELIRLCVKIKSEIVQRDEGSTGERDMLNFGHTLGHAIELLYKIPHGFAVSIGMSFAMFYSYRLDMLSEDEYITSVRLLELMGLPVKRKINIKRAMDLLTLDKKKSGEKIKFVLLSGIGCVSFHMADFSEIENMIKEWQSK